MARKAAPFSSARPSIEYLRHRGPHLVTTGDLDAIGMPGLVFAPQTGPRIPAVIFGHGYLQPVERYADTLRFLASWGFVAAAPATERGPFPSHSGLALDLARVADRLCEAKLNGGRVTVDRSRLAYLGHGIGGGAAVLAAAASAPPAAATVTICAVATSPSAVAAAARVTTPALHIVTAADRIAGSADGGIALAQAWAGPAALRRIKGADHLGIAEGKHFTSTLLGQRASTTAQRAIRTAATAFLLLHLAGQTQLVEAASS